MENSLGCGWLPRELPHSQRHLSHRPGNQQLGLDPHSMLGFGAAVVLIYLALFRQFISSFICEAHVFYLRYLWLLKMQVPTSTRIYSTSQGQLLVCCRSTDSGCLGCSQSQSRGTSSGMVPRSPTVSITRTLHGPGTDQVQWEHRYDRPRSCTCEHEFVTPERRLLLGVCVCGNLYGDGHRALSRSFACLFLSTAHTHPAASSLPATKSYKNKVKL